MHSAFSLRNLCGSAALMLSASSFAVGLSPVTVTSVVPAEDGSDNLVISGTVVNGSNLTSMDINGYPVTLSGNDFSLQMPPASDYQINLFDIGGGSESLNYAAPDAPVDSAIQVVVGNQVLGEVGDAMGRLLADLDLNAVLGIDPSECVINTIFRIGCDMYLRSMEIIGTPDVNLFFTPDGGERMTVNIGMQIPDAEMIVDIKRSYWFGYDRTTMTTSDIEASFQITVEATDNQSIRVILDEPSDVYLDFGSMKVRSINLAAHLIPLFKDAIADLVNDKLVEVGGPFLEQLPIPAIPINLPLDIDGDGTDDAEFAIRMHAELLDVLPGGDGQAVLAGSIFSANVAPGREVLGSRRIGGMLPGAEAVGGTTDITAAIAVDTVNQLLTALYQSGLDQSLAIPLTLADLGAFGSTLTQFGYSLDDNLLLSLNFGAAPELQVSNDGLYPLGLAMGLPQMGIEMQLVTDDGNVLMMAFTGDYALETSLGASPDGQLFLNLYKPNLLNVANVEVTGGSIADDFGTGPIQSFLPVIISAAIYPYAPMIEELLNSARLELDIGEVVTDWLNTDFPSVPVSGYVTEAGVSLDESYMEVGLGIDFPNP